VLTNLSKLLAPITPFLAESMYRNLTTAESVHLSDWPVADEASIKPLLIEEMMMARKIAEMVHAQRKSLAIKVRQPLSKVTVTGMDPAFKQLTLPLGDKIRLLLLDEVNVKNIEYVDPKKDGLSVQLDTAITPALKAEGDARELARKIQVLRKENGCRINEKVKIIIPEEYKNLPEGILAQVLKDTMVSQTLWGKDLQISTG
jgi:isoleucyl-tRNA synthetase